MYFNFQVFFLLVFSYMIPSVDLEEKKSSPFRVFDSNKRLLSFIPLWRLQIRFGTTDKKIAEGKISYHVSQKKTYFSCTLSLENRMNVSSFFCFIIQISRKKYICQKYICTFFPQLICLLQQQSLPISQKSKRKRFFLPCHSLLIPCILGFAREFHFPLCINCVR